MERKDLEQKSMQSIVAEMVDYYKLEISPELRYIDLSSEVGELGKELLKGTDYGKQQFTKTDNLESELGDVLFSLICIANTTNVNIEQALVGVIKKYEDRFNKKGHIGSTPNV